MVTTYRGYITNDPDIASDLYRKRTGFEPTIILARPDFVLTHEVDILVRTRKCMAFGLMVSHEKNSYEYSDDDIMRKKKIIQPVREEKPEKAPEIVDVAQDNKPGRAINYRKSNHKSAKNVIEVGCNCPYCGGKIREFNHLGFWWGWSNGKYPPYWENLKSYVFRRDGHICARCHSKVTEPTCHHIKPKEEGGTDSARNLVTLCNNCHNKIHDGDDGSIKALFDSWSEPETP